MTQTLQTQTLQSQPLHAARTALSNRALLAGVVVALLTALFASDADAKERGRGKISAEPPVIEFVDPETHFVGGRRGGYYGHHDFIPRRVVRRKLRHMGLRQVSDIRFRHGTYRVRAVTPRGHMVRMVFDASTGQVIRARRLGRVGHGRPRSGSSVTFGWTY
ncbi:MAG: hypothetical protein AAF638_01165 [Pseudomonadota bacterium]